MLILDVTEMACNEILARHNTHQPSAPKTRETIPPLWSQTEDTSEGYRGMSPKVQAESYNMLNCHQQHPNEWKIGETAVNWNNKGTRMTKQNAHSTASLSTVTNSEDISNEAMTRVCQEVIGQKMKDLPSRLFPTSFKQ